MAKEFLVKQQQIHDIEANWNKAINFIPLKGEIIVYDPDENFDYSRFKIGDGETFVKDLNFVSPTLIEGSNISINETQNGTIISVPDANESTPGATIVYPAASCTTFTSDNGAATPAAMKKAVSTFGITKEAGGTFSNDATSQGQQPSLKWKEWGANKNTPYIGFASDQSDGTFILGSLSGTNYRNGLAIGGGSGNLLWKGSKVLSASDVSATVASGNSNPVTSNAVYQATQDSITELSASDKLITYTKKNGETGTIVKANSVLAYGAQSNDTTDEAIASNNTKAFQDALLENRVVYVPGGTYVLNDTITVYENCELELEQDTVIKFLQTNKNGISLLRSSTLRGNHATIIVPYNFNAIVVNCDTADDEAQLNPDDLGNSNNIAVPPFKRWDPQWKMTRYIYDINICKPNSNGFHYSDEGDCYGTALFLGCHEGAADFIWGADIKGLRIAGGFIYGIRLYNEGATWNHDSKIETIIDGCETGISIENCNIVHIFGAFQPRAAANNAVYAKNGVKIIDSRWVDLRQFYVWDWTTSNTLVGTKPEYQHIALFGYCPGFQMFDASLTNSNGFWSKIYYDNLATMFGAIIETPKGRLPVDPKYAFYKNFRGEMEYEFLNQNLSWRDPHNMVRYDIPVRPLNPYNNDANKNHLYKIGYFTINGAEENIIGDNAADATLAETITIEENNIHGIQGWSNLYYYGGTIKHYWSPLPSNYDNRVPIYFYSKNGNTFTIYRLIVDENDIQHIYNCKVSITNSRRFIFDFIDVGNISSLDTNTYIRITPEMDTGAPKIAGQVGWSDNKPVVCTKTAIWNTQGSISTQPTIKQLAFEEEVTNRFNTLAIKTEQTDFILPAEGEYVQVPQFTDVKAPYQKNVWNNNGTITTITSGNSIYIEPRAIEVGSIVRIKGIDFSKSWPGKGFMYRFNKSTGAFTDVYNFASSITVNGLTSGTLSGSIGTWVWDESTYTMTLTFSGSGTASWKLGFGGELGNGYTIETVIMTINEELTYQDVWVGEPKRLDESIYSQNVMLTSPNGTVYKLSISDDGIISSEPI